VYDQREKENETQRHKGTERRMRDHGVFLGYLREGFGATTSGLPLGYHRLIVQRQKNEIGVC
jgi:hypothetical protein